jgi:chemotaxis protein CheY-P-specific phosphatase CheC
MDNFNLKKYLAEGKLLKEDTGVDMILSPDQIKRYARMKTVGNISDPKLISKVIEIISDLLPQNPNISKEELANQFGEDVVQKTTQILFSAYLDGYSDKAGNLPLVKDYISIFTQMADDERDEELAEGRLFKEDYKSLSLTPQQEQEFMERIQYLANMEGEDEAMNAAGDILARELSNDEIEWLEDIEEMGYDADEVETTAINLASRAFRGI